MGGVLIADVNQPLALIVPEGQAEEAITRLQPVRLRQRDRLGRRRAGMEGSRYGGGYHRVHHG